MQHLAKFIVQKLQDHGFIAYFAGGSVRDRLMGVVSPDIDIATNATPEEIQSLFPKTILVGVSFGVVVVVLEGHSFEVSSFRKEGLYLDGRRPTSITRATPEEDAARRDFTMNGMFFDPITERLFDYVGGQEDLKNKVIRAIGDPFERFREDRLRMVRAVRFAARLRFEIDPMTAAAIIQNASTLFPAVSQERIWQELLKMASFGPFAEAVLGLDQLKLFDQIFPEFGSLDKEKRAEKIAVIRNLPEKSSSLIKLMPFLKELNEAALEGFALRLKLSRKEKDQLIYFQRALKLLENEAKGTPQDLYDWCQLLAHPESAEVLALGQLLFDSPTLILDRQRMAQTILAPHIDRLRRNSYLIQAEDLIALGIKPGPQMGVLLRLAERLAMNENILNREALLERLMEDPAWPQ